MLMHVVLSHASLANHHCEVGTRRNGKVLGTAEIWPTY